MAVRAEGWKCGQPGERLSPLLPRVEIVRVSLELARQRFTLGQLYQLLSQS